MSRGVSRCEAMSNPFFWCWLLFSKSLATGRVLSSIWPLLLFVLSCVCPSLGEREPSIVCPTLIRPLLAVTC